MDEFKQIQRQLDMLNGRRAAAMEQVTSLRKSLTELQKTHDSAQEARAIIQKVAKETQEQIKARVSSLVSLGLTSIFEDLYEFEFSFVERRNKTEVDLVLKKDGRSVDPLSCGGGVVDVLALTLQLCLLSIRKPPLRRVIILDEPLKWLKGGDYPELGAELIKRISDKLGVQVIMVSHNSELIHAADRVFHIKNKGGTSSVLKRQKDRAPGEEEDAR